MKKTVKFTSDFQNLAKAEEILEAINNNLTLSEENYGNILLSLSEAINNAIVHGNKMDKNKFVTVSYRILPDTIEISVEDQGQGFDPNSIPDPTAPENIERETGRGIFIIKNLSDEVIFEKNGRKITMKFRLTKNKL
jgi:serine/threonine-protein kinase RsbW